MTDELDAPLGKPKKPGLFARFGKLRAPKLSPVALPRPRSWPIARIAFGLSGLILIGAYIRVATVHDPLGGRPSAVVDISSSRNSNAVANDVASAPPAAPTAVTPAPNTAVTTTPSGPQITTVDPNLPDMEEAPVGIQ